MSAPLVAPLPPLRRSLGRPAAVASLVALAALFALLPLALASYQLSIATQILVFSLLAMSIDVLAGFAGRTSLGHGAIFGVASYVVIYWTSSLGGPLWAGLLLGIGAALLLGALFAVLAIRTSGVYFLLLTLALGMIVWGVCLRWTSVTGGENGLRGVGRPAIIADGTRFYYLVLVVAAALSLVMWRFVHSPFGLTLRGIRDSESRMRSLGYNVPLHLFVAFTASGLFAGIAGALYGMFNDFVSPSSVQLSQSVAGLLMAITGGIGTLFGSVVGAAAIILMENVVSTYTARWSGVLGLTFIAVMIFAPEGILGRVRLVLARRGRARSQEGADHGP